MKNKISKLIILMTVCLFFGMLDVKAEVCLFEKETTYADSFRGKETYTIELQYGSLIKAIYQKRDSSGNLVEELNKTATTQVPFISCANIESYTFEGSKYKNLSYSGGGSSSSSNSSSNSGSNSNSSSNSETSTPGWLKSNKVTCGNIGQIPAKGPEIVHMFILIAQIAVPIILVILGMIDFAKGIMSQKEDEIKKGQKTFINRLIIGSIIFFIVALTKVLIGVVADNTSNKDSIISCIDCFANNECGK